MAGGRVDDLEDRLAGAVGHLNAAHSELVAIVGEAADTKAWAGWGIRSLAHWLTWRAGVSPAHAAELVRLADARSTHPKIIAAFHDGELTVDQAALAVKAPAVFDERVAELAKVCAVTQLRTVVRATRPAPDPADGDAEAESVSSFTGDDGRFHLRAELDADHGAIVTAALAAARDRLIRDGDRAVSWVDALLDVCQRSLDTETVPRRERFRVNVYLDPAADIPARWADHSQVPDCITRWLTCDGTLTPTFVDNARPVSVGRAQHIVADRTRRLVVHRDAATCRVPWCPHTRWLQVHHIIHWADGGRTDTANLCTLCPSCHRAHHRGQFAIIGNADTVDGLTFTDPDGHPLTAAPHTTTPTRPPPAPPHPYQHPLGERLYAKWLTFTHPADGPPRHAA